MAYSPFSEDWIQQFSDPFAVLGLSVAADNSRTLKRYRSVAKLLHPDSQMLADKSPDEKDFAMQIFAKLVSPAYTRINQEKGRAETLATLRFRVRRMTAGEEPLMPQTESARQLLRTPIAGVEIFYEQAVSKLAENQFQQLDYFESITLELSELNLIYLRLKKGEPMIREKRVGLAPPSKMKPNPAMITPDPPAVSYAERHYLRAQEYLRKGNPQMAVQELRDAIRIEANQGKYFSMLARAYLAQNLPGAAKAYCRKALELDKDDRLAQACAKRLNIDIANPAPKPSSTTQNRQSAPKEKEKTSGSGLFGGLFARKR